MTATLLEMTLFARGKVTLIRMLIKLDNLDNKSVVLTQVFRLC